MLASANSRSAAGPGARKQPRQRRSRDTVGVILAAAARVIAERGYEAATTNHIAIRAGVSIGSLYQYFPNKASLAAALELQHLDDAGPRLVALAAQLRARRVAPATWIARFVAAVAATNREAHHLAIYGVVPRTPALRARLEALVAALAAELAPVVAGRARRGRARIAIVAAVALVHELVIAAPPRERPAVTREVTAMVTGYLTGRGPSGYRRPRGGRRSR
jgi:AcrR family transcriptional regulator